MMKRFLLLLSLIALLACQKENSEQNPPMNAGQPPMPMTAPTKPMMKPMPHTGMADT